IGAAGELLGVLSVNLPAGAPPTLEEREMIEALAGQAAVAMRNARLFTQSEARRRAAESLAEISRVLAQALDPEVLAQRIVDGARDLLQGHRAVLLRLDSDLGELTTAATSGESRAAELARVARLLTESLDFATAAGRIAETVLPLLRVQASVLRLRQADGSLLAIASAGRTRGAFEPGHRIPPGVGIAGRAVAEGQPVIGDPLGVSTVTTDDFRRRIQASEIQKVLAVPLRVAETILGVLAVGDEAQRAFSAGEVALLQAFGDQAAVALNNAQLFEEAERRRRAAESLAELGQL